MLLAVSWRSCWKSIDGNGAASSSGWPATTLEPAFLVDREQVCQSKIAGLANAQRMTSTILTPGQNFFLERVGGYSATGSKALALCAYQFHLKKEPVRIIEPSGCAGVVETTNMDEEEDLSWDTGERRLARLEGQRRLTASERTTLTDEVRGIVRNEQKVIAQTSAADSARYQAQLETWRAIQRFMHKTPFRDRAGLKRSDQWRSVLDRVRCLGQLELVDWVALQVEVASNREKGIPDMRPRKNGHAFLVMLEYVGNRKRKALALLKWALEAEREGFITSGIGGTISECLQEQFKSAEESNTGNQRL